jgi:hypothetical protein
MMHSNLGGHSGRVSHMGCSNTVLYAEQSIKVNSMYVYTPDAVLGVGPTLPDTVTRLCCGNGFEEHSCDNFDSSQFHRLASI